MAIVKAGRKFPYRRCEIRGEYMESNDAGWDYDDEYYDDYDPWSDPGDGWGDYSDDEDGWGDYF